MKKRIVSIFFFSVFCTNITFSMFKSRKIRDEKHVQQIQLNKHLSDIFDEKTMHEILAKKGYAGFYDMENFRMGNAANKLRCLKGICFGDQILQQDRHHSSIQDPRVDPVIEVLDTRTRKRVKICQLISFWQKEQIKNPFLKSFCMSYLIELVKNIEDIAQYKVVTKNLSNEARAFAFNLCKKYDVFSFSPVSSFDYADAWHIKYFEGQVTDEINFDIILFVSNLDMISRTLELDTLSGLNFHDSYTFVEKETYKVIKLINYIWERIKSKIDIKDVERVERELQRLNDYVKEKDMRYYFLKCLSPFLECFGYLR